MYDASSHPAYTRGTGTTVFCKAFITRYSRITSCAVGSKGPRGGRRSAHELPEKWTRWTSLECPNEIFSHLRPEGSPSLRSVMKRARPFRSTVAFGPVFSVAASPGLLES